MDAFQVHCQSLEWMKKKLMENKAKTNVVVTHHAPSIISLPQHKHEDWVSAAYASHLDDMITEYRPNYWFHGHIHTSVDYKVGDCRIICNPRGYPDKPKKEFNPKFTVKIE